MPTRQNGRISQLLGRRARSARARGLRTLQHQALARSTLAAIDAEIWLRTLIVEHWSSEAPQNSPADAAWATKDQVHDEALSWYLDRLGDAHPRAPAVDVALASAPAVTPGRPGRGRARRGVSRQATHQDVTFWVDSRLLARARRLALREGLRLAQLIERALDTYIAEHIRAEVVRFHRRAQRQALRLHQRRVAAAAKREAD